jgi:hypothetical protein
MKRFGELDIDRQLREALQNGARVLLAKIELEKQLEIIAKENGRLRGLIAEMVKVAEKVKGEV